MALLAGAILAPSALADDFLPHPDGGQWTYRWSDDKYNPNGTTETVAVDTTDPATCGWQLKWSGDIQIPIGSGSGGGTSPVLDQPDTGTICFQDQGYGLVNTNWSGSSPPIDEPPLCPSSTASGACANSLGSVMYNVIWGTRTPTLTEPLVQGTSWNATGGGDGSVTSTNTYLGQQTITEPAYPHGITAWVVRSQIALAGTPGDDYGSGTRTIWWVPGVGPVRLVFDHVDGSVTQADLWATNLTPDPPRSDVNYFPLRSGLSATYRWTNPRYLKRPEIERLSIPAAVSQSARVSVKSVSGPMRAAGDYVFSLRLDGLRNTYASNAAVSLAKWPKLGSGRRFFTPVDLMIYGFNPVLGPYAIPGQTWFSGNARDRSVYGVTGATKVIGLRWVTVPAGRFYALEVQSVLSQKGHPFGSGLRTMWFAPNRGLVKLVFHHRDGSTSTVVMLRR
ncbi:MAG TPA: hypothetical protein VFN55_14370 [Solirubrobacteraceae bacterium]|nr:hypothetical protein [Solirubrobacteraceae bacterium]